MKLKRFFAMLITVCILLTSMTVMAAETDENVGNAEAVENAVLKVGESVTVEPGEYVSFSIQVEEAGEYTLYAPYGDYGNFFYNHSDSIQLKYQDGSELGEESIGSSWQGGTDMEGTDAASGQSWMLRAEEEYALSIRNTAATPVTFSFVERCSPTSITFGSVWDIVLEKGVQTANIPPIYVTPCYASKEPSSWEVVSSDPSVVEVKAVLDGNYVGYYTMDPLKEGVATITTTYIYKDGARVSDSENVVVKLRSEIEAGKEYTLVGSDRSFFTYKSTHECGYRLNVEFAEDDHFFNFSIYSSEQGYSHSARKSGVMHSSLNDNVFSFPVGAEAGVEISSSADYRKNHENATIIYSITPNHEVMVKTEAEDATYSEDGNIEYYTCPECGTITTDKEAYDEITLADTVIPKLSEISVDANSAKLSSDTFDEMLAVNESLTVKMKDCTVIIDTPALEAITEQAEGDTTLAVELIDAEDLTDTQKAAIVGEKVVGAISATIMCNGEEIHDFNNGTVTIKIPFTPAEETNGEDYSILYVAEDGTVEVVETAYENGYLVMKTVHFSEYVIVYNAPSSDNNSSDNTENSDLNNSSTPADDNNSSSVNNNNSSNTENKEESSKNDSSNSSVVDNEKTETSGTPETGDNAQTVAFVCVAVIAMLFMVAATAAKKKLN